MPQLTLIKYNDETGEIQKLRVIDEACHKWMDLGLLLHVSFTVLENLAQKYNRDPCDCLREVFFEHFIENKSERYSQDWNGLIELLEDANLSLLAHKTKSALLAKN